MVENGVLDRLVDGRIIGRLENRKFLRLRIGVDQNGKSRIGTADITDQDRKFHDVVGICLCNHYRFPILPATASLRVLAGARCNKCIFRCVIAQQTSLLHQNLGGRPVQVPSEYRRRLRAASAP